MHACIAARDRFPAGKHFFDDETERQRGHAQVDALTRSAGKPTTRPTAADSSSGAGQGQGKGPAHADQHSLG